MDKIYVVSVMYTDFADLKAVGEYGVSAEVSTFVDSAWETEQEAEERASVLRARSAKRLQKREVTVSEVPVAVPCGQRVAHAHVSYIE